MGGQDEGEAAGGAFGGEGADFGFAARAAVAFSGELSVTGAEGGLELDGSGWEAHHEKRADSGGLRMCGRGGCCFQHQLAKVLFV